MNSKDNFALKIFEFENSRKEKYKKENGVYYTDLDLSEKIISDLNLEKDSVILDPCCGAGSFIYSAIKLGFQYVFGADSDTKAVKFCKDEISGIQCKKIDTISKSGNDVLKNMKVNRVDAIVGNPPYVPIIKGKIISDDSSFQKDVSKTGNNLFVAALMSSFELVREGGVISYIIPKNFLHVPSYNNLRLNILKNKTIISITDLGIYFKNVRGEQIILTLKNLNPDKNNTVEIIKLEHRKFISKIEIRQSDYKNEIILFDTYTDYEIYLKFVSSYKTIGETYVSCIKRGREKINFVSGKQLKKFGYKKLEIPKSGNQIFIQNIYSAESGIIATFGGDLKAGETITVLTDGNEDTCRFLLGILHSRLCNYVLYMFSYNYSKLTMHTDANYLKKIPLPEYNIESYNKIIRIVLQLESIEYMCVEWLSNLEDLNREVYAAYALSSNEMTHIDTTMKQIQSKRWTNNE